MEHLEHFKLRRDPFSNEPDLRFFFESDSHKDAQRRIERSIRQGKGLTVMTGPHGTGKSLLARRLFEDLEEEMFETILMVMLPGATEARTVLGRLARELGVEKPGEERSNILAHIYEQLAIVREGGRNFVLIIDDAQTLGAQVMSEIGGLLSMEYEGRRMLSLLLVGSSEVDQCLAGDASLEQRVDVRVRLHPMDLRAIKEYVDHRVNLVSGPADLISDEALKALFKLSRGRPRLVNTLADNALFEAYLKGRAEVRGAEIERAAADLGLGSEASAMAITSESHLGEFDLCMEQPARATPGAVSEELNQIPLVAFDTVIANDDEAPMDPGVQSRIEALDLDGDDLFLDVEAPDESTAVPELHLSDVSGGAVSLLDEKTMDLEFEWAPESSRFGSEFDPPSLPLVDAPQEISQAGTGFEGSAHLNQQYVSPRDSDSESEVDEVFAELLEG